MSLSIERLRTLLRRGLGGVDDVDLPDAEADELLNLSLWSIEDTYPFRAKETTYSTELVEGQRVYSLLNLSRLDALQSIVVIDAENRRKKLSRATRSWFDENGTDNPDARGMPSRYFRERISLYLDPIPSASEVGYILEVAAKESVESVSSSGDSATGLPRNWDEIVLYGAIYRGRLLNSDHQEADRVLNIQLGLIRASVPTEAKEETDSRYARLDVLTEAPEDWR